MTLIAAIRIEGCAILIGDLLISGDMQPVRPTVLPTIGDLPEGLTLSSSEFITGTAQKICIVNPRLAVAWAGRKVYATHIIKKMKVHFSRRKLDYDSLEKFFLRQKEEYLKEIEMICWYANRKGINSFSVNTVNIDTEGYGHCHIGGSGSGEFITLLYEDMQFRLKDGTPNFVENGVARAVALASMILGREISTGANLASYYGGGIEITTHAGNKFRKVGNLLHLFWNFISDHSGERLEFIPIAYKLDYVKRDLVIRRINFGVDQEGKNVVDSHNIFVIPPIIREKETKEINLDALPNLNAQFFANHVYFQYPSGEMGAKVTVNFSPSMEGPFRITEIGRDIKLSFNGEFFAHEMKVIKDEIAQASMRNPAPT